MDYKYGKDNDFKFKSKPKKKMLSDADKEGIKGLIEIFLGIAVVGGGIGFLGLYTISVVEMFFEKGFFLGFIYFTVSVATIIGILFFILKKINKELEV